MIKNGIVYLDKINEAKMEIDLIPRSNRSSRPGYLMKPTSITIHNTGNRKAGATAHTKFIDESTEYISWHFTVDDKYIYQELPITEVAWHAGDGSKGPGNRSSVAIEICEHEGIDWEKSKANAISLIVILLNEMNLTPNDVVPHQKWSGKYCPHKILDEGWNDFVKLIKIEFSRINKIINVSAWAKDSWLKAIDRGIQDGIGPKNNVTEEQLMVFFDILGLL